jgi:hypothetical protein
MVRRLPYYFLFVVALAYVAVKWKTFSYDLRLIEAGSAQGYFALGYLILVLVSVVVAIFGMRRDRPSTGLRDRLNVLRTTTSDAFARSPMRTSVRLLLCFTLGAAIPLGLFVLVHPHGFGTLAAGDWVLLGMMEFPVALVAVVMLAGIRRIRHVAAGRRSGDA